MVTPGEKRVFFFYSSTVGFYSNVLTEGPLFSAQKRAVRQAEGPLPLQSGGKNTTIPLFSRLDLPSEQRLVIKVTSQQVHALAVASRSIVVH